MMEFFNKHTIKLQLGIFLSIVGFIIYWTFIGASYAKQIDINTVRLDALEEKVDELATKEDLKILKDDIKYFIRTNN
jgi:hypothetical protein